MGLYACMFTSQTKLTQIRSALSNQYWGAEYENKMFHIDKYPPPKKAQQLRGTVLLREQKHLSYVCQFVPA